MVILQMRTSVGDAVARPSFERQVEGMFGIFIESGIKKE
jgi:hypothetical protein